MTEKEFEYFCKNRFKNPDFLLGRQRHKDPTEASIDHFLNGGDVKSDIDGISDISDILSKRALE